MAYALTQKDLQDLASQGVNIDGIPEGAEATAEEMSLLNVQPTPSPAADAPATGAPAGLTPTQQSYNAARAQGVAPENAPQSGGIPVTTPTPSPAMGAGGMGGGIMDLLSQPISQDPFENLSRSQRTMIGFAALKDAGMALQGKEGGAVRGVMDDITARADMERKRQAALAQREVMANLLGGGGAASGGALNTPEAIRNRIQQLTQFAMTNPSMAAGVGPEIQRLQSEAERLTQAQTQLASTNMGVAAVEALMRSPDLDQITGMQGVGNEWLEKIGAAPKYSNLMSYVEQLRGLNFLEAYQGLKGGGPITDIEGSKAQAARARIDRALRGTPADLKAALEEVGALFQEAREKNPMYDQELDFGQQTPPPAPTPTFNQDEIDDYLK